jgi:hypothetical protein
VPLFLILSIENNRDRFPKTEKGSQTGLPFPLRIALFSSPTPSTHGETFTHPPPPLKIPFSLNSSGEETRYPFQPSPPLFPAFPSKVTLLPPERVEREWKKAPTLSQKVSASPERLKKMKWKQKISPSRQIFSGEISPPSPLKKTREIEREIEKSGRNRKIERKKSKN